MEARASGRLANALSQSHLLATLSEWRRLTRKGFVRDLSDWVAKPPHPRLLPPPWAVLRTEQAVRSNLPG